MSGKGKKLLTESEFRKFSSLAKLDKLTGRLVKEMYLQEEDPKDPKDPLKEADMDDMDGMDDMGDEYVPEGEDEEDGDMEVDLEDEEDEEGGEEEGSGSEIRMQIEDALQDLLSLIDRALDRAGIGDVMDVETGEEGAEGQEDAEGGDVPEVAPPAPMGGDMTAPEGDDKALMETVAKRVMNRLREISKNSSKQNKVAPRRTRK